MRITIVAATRFELEPFFKQYQPQEDTQFKGLYYIDDNLHILITGMGMLNTAAHLMWYANKYDREIYIDAGVAGAFNRNLNIGDVVTVISETYGDFGVENDEAFEDFFDLGFIDQTSSSFEYGLCFPLPHSIQQELTLPKVSSITVNKVHGNEKTIAQIQSKYQADIENMEGLAFFYVLKLMQLPGIEIRSISNYVEKRNKENWNLTLAINNLNTEIMAILKLIAA